jgi:riboflavin transporter FmnP
MLNVLGTIFIAKLMFILAYTVIMPIYDKRVKETENFAGNY